MYAKYFTNSKLTVMLGKLLFILFFMLINIVDICSVEFCISGKVDNIEMPCNDWQWNVWNVLAKLLPVLSCLQSLPFGVDIHIMDRVELGVGCSVIV